MVSKTFVSLKVFLCLCAMTQVAGGAAVSGKARQWGDMLQQMERPSLRSSLDEGLQAAAKSVPDPLLSPPPSSTYTSKSFPQTSFSERTLPAPKAQFQSEDYVKNILRQRIDEEQRGVGIVVGLVDQHGTTVVSHGKAGLSPGKKLNGDTLFELGSVTKTYTNLLLADMLKRGKIRSLDDPISQYLPQYYHVTNAVGQAQLRPLRLPKKYGKKITFRHLANHTAGLPWEPSNYPFQDFLRPGLHYDAAKLYEFLGNYKLPRRLGGTSAYSNVGAGLLGHTLAQIEGKPLAQLMNERIFKPLGMNRTVMELPDRLRHEMADGFLTRNKTTYPITLGVLDGAIGLKSSVHDQIKYLRANTGLDKTELLPAMRTAHRATKKFEHPKTKIGLGWQTMNHHKSPIVFHDGTTLGQNSFIGFDPERQVGVVVLANSLHDVRDIGMHLLNPKYELYTTWNPPPRAAQLSHEKLVDYIGFYGKGDDQVEIAWQEGQLFLGSHENVFVPIHPKATDEFFFEGVDFQVRFTRNKEGKITLLEADDAGNKSKLKRQ